LPVTEPRLLSSPELTVVVPVYNSSQTLEELYERLQKVLSSLSQAWEIILVDDASSDSSFQVMEGLRERDSRVQIIRFRRNHGQHAALMCGLKYSRGPFVFTLDDDLQHPPEEFPKLLDEMKKGYQVVIGRYDVKRHSAYRNLGSRVVNRLISVLTGKPPHLALTNLKLFSRKAVDAMTAFKGKKFYLSMVLFDAIPASSVCNVDVRHHEREYGASGYTFWKSLKLMSTIFIYHTRFSFFFTLAGVISMGLTIMVLLSLKQYTFFCSFALFLEALVVILGTGGMYLKEVSQDCEDPTPFLNNTLIADSGNLPR
jgi:glycosyltransferase involved in cell wall biosynthesis